MLLLLLLSLSALSSLLRHRPLFRLRAVRFVAATSREWISFLVAHTSFFTAVVVSSNKLDSSPSALCLADQPSRSDFFSAVAGGAVLAAATGAVAPPPALAAKYGSFGAGSPEVLNPAEADVDREILASGPVQAALKKVQAYQQAVARLQSTLAADPQANIRSTLLKELDAAGLRETLNAVNTAFDEDTQRGTDRLIRVILQDITELEQANAQKEGIPRSPRRLDIMNGKLTKLSQAFGDYLAFAK